jgi:hypothetical protein
MICPVDTVRSGVQGVSLVRQIGADECGELELCFDNNGGFVHGCMIRPPRKPRRPRPRPEAQAQPQFGAP